MSDPQHLDLYDWVSIAATSVLTGVGSAMAWFTGEKKKIDARIDKAEEQIGKHTAQHANADTQLAVIHTNQGHMSNRLDELRESAASTHNKLDEVLRRMT